MKFEPDRAQGVHQVTRHGAEGLWVDGQLHEGSVIVPWSGGVRPWPPRRVEDLDASCFAQLLELEPEVVIFGSGVALRFPPASLVLPLMQARIGVETMDTRAACRTFNVLASEGRRVVAALMASS